MTDLNHVVLIGRLTRDLGSDERDFGYLPNGQARANVSIAVNRSKKQGDEWIDEVSYFEVAIFGKTAENLKPYLLKGKQICVDGHLKQDRWKDQQGNNRSKISIVAENVQLLGGKSEDTTQNAGGNYQQQSFTPKANTQYQTPPAPPSDDEFPEDIPF
ncbi:MAG: single-stranded DNA-binding protein [Treponema sp.]|uniref:single-stranded DNA-binding protein n=1 Tax=Treponema sp. TaxID=166 RepID=UPI0025FEEA2B|nr:single-stranded DNA-binding protein [Treponema sp.]MBQ8679534.1 single-stranded DNA-binding protein [Treponema sp.]MBR1637979.1 single-stranded DNA-binding protein [Treponema sp.]